MKKHIDMTVFRSPVKSTEGKIVHLFKQRPGSTVSFDPDVQDAVHVAIDRYQKGSPFVCKKQYEGSNDLITHKPEKVTCRGCKP